MEHLVALVESLAWPAAIIWLGYQFRAEIRTLISKVSHLKYKDVEARFEKELAAAEVQAKAAIVESGPYNDEEPVYPAPYDERYYQLLRIADESPRAALIEAWIEVEGSLLTAAEKIGMKLVPHAPDRIIDALFRQRRIAKTVIPLFESLRKMRNEAIHVPDFMPSSRLVRRYLQLAIELSLTFRNLPKEQPKDAK